VVAHFGAVAGVAEPVGVVRATAPPAARRRRGNTVGDPVDSEVHPVPRHDVEMSIPTTKVILHADVVFEVRSDGEKLGDLHVSQGTIDWYQRNARRSTRLTWEQFDRLMQEQRG
jgi:hypothetical protein